MAQIILTGEDGISIPRKLLTGVVKKTLQTVDYKNSKYFVCVSLVNDPFIKKLNKLYRGKDKPTDVLSFEAPKGLPSFENFLGDVIISVQTAKKNAKQDGVAFKEMLAELTIHGLLHLLGYDHEKVSKNKEQKMMTLQKKIKDKVVVELL